MKIRFIGFDPEAFDPEAPEEENGETGKAAGGRVPGWSEIEAALARLGFVVDGYAGREFVRHSKVTGQVDIVPQNMVWASPEMLRILNDAGIVEFPEKEAGA